jgi:hypothetical protein
MGQVQLPLLVKLMVGMLAGTEEYFQRAEERLKRHFGPVDFRSPLLPFTHTGYYSQEMGQGLHRKFIAFAQLIDPGDLAEAKRFTNRLEEELAEGGPRCVNLDPGYISPGKLVLATTKDREHRIYLGDGIYAEVTLRWRRQEGYEPWEWTYPDYRTDDYRSILGEIRRLYMRQRREEKTGLFGDEFHA